MSNSAPAIDCPKCDGKGKIKLSTPLLETLRIVRKKGEATAKDVLGLLPYKVAQSAINNRLELLRRMNLVKRARSGASYLYSPA